MFSNSSTPGIDIGHNDKNNNNNNNNTNNIKVTFSISISKIQEISSVNGKVVKEHVFNSNSVTKVVYIFILFYFRLLYFILYYIILFHFVTF